MQKAYDVVALGELLTDFTEEGTDELGNPRFTANPGGAPCNVLAMLAKLGKRTAFIGKVGDDSFGRELAEAAQSCDIDVTGLRFDPAVPTTSAYIHTLPDGDREFSFSRDPGADQMLTKEEVDADLIRKTRIFHFGSLSSTSEPAREATRYALEVAAQAGVWLSFDPNLREALWDDPADARREIGYGLARCDILKISDNEMEFLTGTRDCDAGVAMLRGMYPLPLIFVTLGAEGSRACYRDRVVSAPPFLREDTIETTGAGDAFMGCALSYLLEHGSDDLSDAQLKELLAFANAGASLVTTRKGALYVMPDRQEIEDLLSGSRGF